MLWKKWVDGYDMLMNITNANQRSSITMEIITISSFTGNYIIALSPYIKINELKIIT
jgi:hypothetical protein